MVLGSTSNTFASKTHQRRLAGLDGRSEPGCRRRRRSSPGNDSGIGVDKAGNVFVLGGSSVAKVGPLVPAFTLASPTCGVYLVGDSIEINWTAARVVGGSKISLCFDQDTTWGNGNEHWIEIDQVSAANGAGYYIWNTTGVAAGTYYVAGYMYDGTYTLSHLTESITILPNLPPTFALSGPTSGTYRAGQTVNIQWTADNVRAGKVSLCYDADATWNNGNEHWIEIDQVSAANAGGSYDWNTTGVAAGTYYLAGYLYDRGMSCASPI